MKNRKYNRIPAILLMLLTVLAMFGCQKNFSYNYENNPVQTPNGTGYELNADISFSASTSSEEKNQEDTSQLTVEESGEYSSKDEVALYIHTYGHLPSNYITKNEAKNLGWDSSKGNLWDVASGKSIGGDKFGNREGLLPKADKRQYYECDIDFDGGYRNEKRIIYSNDGLIYYTGDHYNSFTQLY